LVSAGLNLPLFMAVLKKHLSHNKYNII
jgi:hypothetical protein